MEPNDSRSLDWKTCFKKILAPHLLDPSNDEDPHLSNPSDSEENDACQINVNSKNDSVSTTAFLTNQIKENVQKNINASISLQSIHTDDGTDLTCGKQNNSETPHEREESIENIISADAELLAKTFKSLKVKKKEKYFFNKAEKSRNLPDWNTAFKKVLDPKFDIESSLKTPQEFVDEKPYSSHPDLLDSWETNCWTHHRLCKDEHLEKTEVPAQPSQENCNKNRRYTKKEKEVLELLKLSRSFKPPQKANINAFDGAGVNHFKDSKNKSVSKNRSSNTKKPNNTPPPGGWVCVKPLTIEEFRNRPRNIIFSECWDWDEDDW